MSTCGNEDARDAINVEGMQVYGELDTKTDVETEDTTFKFLLD